MTPPRGGGGGGWIREQYTVWGPQSKCQFKENLKKYKEEKNRKQQVPNQIFSRIVTGHLCHVT